VSCPEKIISNKLTFLPCTKTDLPLETLPTINERSRRTFSRPSSSENDELEKLGLLTLPDCEFGSEAQFHVELELEAQLLSSSPSTYDLPPFLVILLPQRWIRKHIFPIPISRAHEAQGV